MEDARTGCESLFFVSITGSRDQLKKVCGSISRLDNIKGPLAEVGTRMVQPILLQPFLIAVQIGQVILGAGKPGEIAVAPAELVFGPVQPVGFIQKERTDDGHGAAPVHARLTMDQDGSRILLVQDYEELAYFLARQRGPGIRGHVEEADAAAAGNGPFLLIPIRLGG